LITLARATIEDCLDFAGGRFFARKRVIHMHQNGEALLIADRGEPIALAFIAAAEGGQREFSLALRAGARVHMRKLCRAAQLILGRMAQDGPVIAYIVPGNRAGERMARIVGFAPDPEHRFRWILRGRERSDFSQNHLRRRRHETGGAGRAAAGGQQ
jgi:hypothetical protein